MVSRWGPCPDMAQPQEVRTEHLATKGLKRGGPFRPFVAKCLIQPAKTWFPGGALPRHGRRGRRGRRGSYGAFGNERSKKGRPFLDLSLPNAPYEPLRPLRPLRPCLGRAPPGNHVFAGCIKHLATKGLKGPPLFRPFVAKCSVRTSCGCAMSGQGPHLETMLSQAVSSIWQRKV